MIEPTDLVLIAVVNQPRDLEIARILGWYRIPLRRAPKLVAVDALAFYQTGAFGSERWRIAHAARLRGVELTTRGELLREEPDHPRVHEEYYKLQIGPVEPLPHPVVARIWRRITFLYTTGELLLGADEVNDLIVQSDERELLWRSLRERGSVSDFGYGIPAGGEMDEAFFFPPDTSRGRVIPGTSVAPPEGQEDLSLPSGHAQPQTEDNLEWILREVTRLGQSRTSG